MIYDLFMTMRFDREIAKALGVWKVLCRLARQFRDDDEAKRKGRRSWRDPRDVVADRPSLRADRLG